jgi:acyl-CoA:acyl-CoA alkyltransferase
MRFQDVCIESFSHVLADEVVRSEALELGLAPLYARLGLSVGRLELMTGIRERRFFAPGTRPSAKAAEAAELALRESRIDRARIGCLIYGAVCRDFLEPASASIVHSRLGLPPDCLLFDITNACLGFCDGLVTLATLIEGRQIEAGLVVAAEDGRALVEATLAALLADPRTGKRELKAAFASLTIGSGAAAAVLAHRSIAKHPSRRLLGALARSATEQVELCHGEQRAGSSGPLMETDSEGLLLAGNALAGATFERFTAELGWTREDIDRVVTHQVGVAHRRLLFASLELDPALDFPTVETFGNVGSVSLPLTYALACEQGFIRRGQRVAMLGIGSGLNCLMLGVES